MADLDDIRPDEVANFHIDDLKPGKPRELFTDADRVMPGDGTLPLVEMIRKLQSTGYSGKVMLELFSPEWWGRPPAEVCQIGRQKVEAVLAAV